MKKLDTPNRVSQVQVIRRKLLFDSYSLRVDEDRLINLDNLDN